MVKNLDINSCTLCKHIDYARGRKGEYMLCLKADRIIQRTNVTQCSDVALLKVNIPEWCPLPNYDEPELLKKE